MKNIFIFENSNIYQAMENLQKTSEKCLIVINKSKRLLGTITDGDIRRAILNRTTTTTNIKKIYKKDCIYLEKKKYNISKVLKIINSKEVNLVPIVNDKKIVIDYVTAKKTQGLTKVKKVNLDVVIMAGGKGTRLQPFTHILPKPLIPVKGKPIIEKIIENFIKYGAKKFIISINYKSKIIKSFFDELNPAYKYKFIEEKKPLGTAGSLAFLKSKIKKNYFITNCDILLNFDYSEVYDYHKKNNYDLTVVVSTKKFTVPYGSCKINKSGLLESIKEKPSQHLLVNTGMYVVNNQLFKFIKKNKFTNFTDFISICKKRKKRIGVYPVSDQSWLDFGQWDEYIKTKKIYEKK